ncbi:MAG: hypothetical protein AB8G18_02565 [Gammaproteobacteria bacterium]
MKLRKWLATALSVFAITVGSVTACASNSLPLKVFNIDGVHVADDGSIYAAEGFTGNRVFSITPEGQVLIVASGLAGPIDIATDSLGNLYVSNFNDATVSKITPEGEVTKFADVLPGPAGIVVDSHDNVIVSQYGVGGGDGTAITKISPDGTVSALTGGGFLLAPVATAIDSHDNVYVANFNEGSVIKVSPHGEQELLAKVDAPDGFAIGHMAFANNRLFATSIAAQKIIVIRANGTVRERGRRLEEGRFPNGMAYDAINNTVLFTYGFGTVSNIEKIRLQQH